MVYWSSFGASVIGPGHIVSKKPNQDAWGSFHHPYCDGIVVSDGLGSKEFSHHGSSAACLAVEHAVFSMWLDECDSLDEDFLENVKNYWIDYLEGLEPRTAAATCLFAIVYESKAWIGQLGDGCAAVVRTDGRVSVLTDDKSGSFSNMTDSLATNASADKWRLFCVPEEEVAALVLCTDGVSDDIVGLDNLKGFIKGFAESSAEMATIVAAREAKDMLENWPTPKHADDKTIACLLRKEAEDE